MGGRGLARAAQGKARGRSPSTSDTAASTPATKKTCTSACSTTGGRAHRAGETYAFSVPTREQAHHLAGARAAAADRGGRARHEPIASPRSSASDLRRRHRADAPQRAPALARAGRPRAKPRGVDGHRDRTTTARSRSSAAAAGASGASAPPTRASGSSSPTSRPSTRSKGAPSSAAAR